VDVASSSTAMKTAQVRIGNPPVGALEISTES
jgi:hypothetical protein